MTTQADGKPNAVHFAVPISIGRRITDFAVLVGGILIIVHSIRVGDAALLLLPLGIAVCGAALWLLSRKKRRLPPPKLAKRFGAALAERIGNAASTPDGRSHYIHEYLNGVQELKQLTDGVWEVASRGMHGDYETIVHFNTPDRKVSVTARPCSDDDFVVSVSGLTDRERAMAEQVLGIRSTETPEVLHLGEFSGEQAVQITERVFCEVLDQELEYVLTAWLECILPPGIYGNVPR